MRLISFLIFGGALLGYATSADAQRRGRPANSTPPALCPPSQVPQHGDALNGDLPVLNQKGLPNHQLTIDNGTRSSAILKIDDLVRPAQRYFIAPGRQLTVELGDGSYEIQYVMNGRLARDCRTVLSADQVLEFPGRHRLQVEDNGDSWGYQVISFTLYAVDNGNVRPAGISLTEFNRD